MIYDAIKYELLQMFPDWTVHLSETDETDQIPPYFVAVLVDGAPEGSGSFGRWQITGNHIDKEFLEREIMPAVIRRFHNISGLIGEPGKEEAFLMCGCVGEYRSVKDDNGVFGKPIDLMIYYR